jgi:hypothetical protein
MMGFIVDPVTPPNVFVVHQPVLHKDDTLLSDLPDFVFKAALEKVGRFPTSIHHDQI